MSAPQLTVAVDGQGTVSGDQLNTYLQGCDTAADLRGFVGIQGIQVYIRGTAAPNDGGQGFFYWNVNGTAPDDNGVTTIVPYGSGSGEWTRLELSSGAVRFTHTYPDPAGSTTMVGVMMGIGQTVTPNKSGDLLITFAGVAGNDTAGDGAYIELRYGTGPAPANGAALTGTEVIPTEMTAAANGQMVPFSITIYINSFIVGTTYWLDLSLAALTGGTATMQGVNATVIEL